MTTVMTEAMKEAGVAPLTKCRIWMYLKDHPNKTARDIVLALKLNESSVYTMLSDMNTRGMIESKKDNLPARNRGPGLPYRVVWKAIGDKYELQPKVKKEKHPLKTLSLVPEVAEKKTVGKKAMRLEDLSVVEAKQLYDQLKEIFG